MAMIVNAIVAASTVPSAEESDMVEKRSTPLMIRAKIGTANSNARLNLSWLSPCLIFFCQNACKGGHNICCKGQSCDLAPDHDGRVVRNAYEETAEKGNIYYDTEEHKQIGRQVRRAADCLVCILL